MSLKMTIFKKNNNRWHLKKRNQKLPLWQLSHCLPILFGRQEHCPVFWLQARFSWETLSPSWVPDGSQSQVVQPVTCSRLSPHVLPRHWLQLEPSTFDLHTQSPESCITEDINRRMFTHLWKYLRIFPFLRLKHKVWCFPLHGSGCQH